MIRRRQQRLDGQGEQGKIRHARRGGHLGGVDAIRHLDYALVVDGHIGSADDVVRKFVRIPKDNDRTDHMDDLGGEPSIDRATGGSHFREIRHVPLFPGKEGAPVILTGLIHGLDVGMGGARHRRGETAEAVNLLWGGPRVGERDKDVALHAHVVGRVTIAPAIRRLLLAEAERRKLLPFQRGQRIRAGGAEDGFVQRHGEESEPLDVIAEVLEIVVGDNDDTRATELRADGRKEGEAVTGDVIELADAKREIRHAIQCGNAILRSIRHGDLRARRGAHYELTHAIRQRGIRVNDQDIGAHGKKGDNALKLRGCQSRLFIYLASGMEGHPGPGSAQGVDPTAAG